MAKEIYNKNAREAHLMAEAYSQVNEGHAGPVPNWKKQAGLEKEFNELENKREEARDRGREAEDKGDWDEWNKQENEREGAKDALRETEKRYQLKSVGGMHSEQESVVGEFDTIDEVIEHIGPQKAPRGEYGNEWVKNIKDGRNWSSEGFQDGLSHFGIGEIFDVVDTQSVVEDAEMEFDERGYAKNTEAGYEREDDRGGSEEASRQWRWGSDPQRGIQVAGEALDEFKDTLTEYHAEDIDIEKLTDVHDALSRALHKILDADTVDYVLGGRATQQAERDVDFKPAHGEY